VGLNQTLGHPRAKRWIIPFGRNLPGSQSPIPYLFRVVECIKLEVEAQLHFSDSLMFEPVFCDARLVTNSRLQTVLA